MRAGPPTLSTVWDSPASMIASSPAASRRTVPLTLRPTQPATTRSSVCSAMRIRGWGAVASRSSKYSVEP